MKALNRITLEDTFKDVRSSHQDLLTVSWNELFQPIDGVQYLELFLNILFKAFPLLNKPLLASRVGLDFLANELLILEQGFGELFIGQ
jgi:hypothetical protein